MMNIFYWSCLILRDDTIFFTQLIPERFQAIVS